MKYELIPMFDRKVRWYRFYIKDLPTNRYCVEGVCLNASKNENLHLMRVVRKGMIEALTA